jgi:thioredoxin-related protein
LFNRQLISTVKTNSLSRTLLIAIELVLMPHSSAQAQAPLEPSYLPKAAASLIGVRETLDFSLRHAGPAGALDVLPLDLSFKIVKGNGARRVAVFSDPDCPYCKRLEKSLIGVTDVTIYVFPYLLTQNHPDALRKASLLWCSANPGAAWERWMQADVLPTSSPHCATPFDAVTSLGNTIGVRGTPTIVFDDGTVIPGAMSADDFTNHLGNR